MPPGQEAKRPAPAIARDLLGALPDALLQHILSFLPTQQAVRTCVLARRWQHLWEDMTGLRIRAANSPEVPCAPEELTLVGDLREFVDHLLLLRGRSPIDTCEFMFNVPVTCEDDVPHVNLWIRHVIRCNVRVLKLSITREDHDLGLYFSVSALPIISRHLRRLELYDTRLNDSILNFSGCPVLEELEIYNGNFVHSTKMLSKSVKHLSLLDCSASEQLRTYIDVPNLLSLRLEDPSDRTPVLGSMPSLVSAFVRYGPQTWSDDRCYNSESGDCDDDQCQGCYTVKGANSDDCNNNGTTKNKSVLLRGLSEAESLVLIDECQAGPEYKVKIKGIHSAMEASTISENLTVVEVECDMVDERVLEVLNFLRTLNICFSYEEQKGQAEPESITS
ncbi:hypothetical protein PR202_gb16099 [Eleusine coracana subsp. coracana]|uniref:F-box domain-containing protein n=1 Tax=Eleusine coracana subsp. coracana TaxID=191504 RepID=A0AAV5EX82_ELECO|nr:hypothetical protein PR202_gb16099 [Eleusine coracana subsp. coracana]